MTKEEAQEIVDIAFADNKEAHKDLTRKIKEAKKGIVLVGNLFTNLNNKNMKTKLTLLSIVLLSFIGCSTDDRTTTECECVKTYYLYFPAMSFGDSYIPAHYDIVSSQIGNFDCDSNTGGYVHDPNLNYTHYKIQCD